jgi:hypothetical protein
VNIAHFAMRQCVALVEFRGGGAVGLQPGSEAAEACFEAERRRLDHRAAVVGDLVGERTGVERQLDGESAVGAFDFLAR